jgi:hypothetical protein
MIYALVELNHDGSEGEYVKIGFVDSDDYQEAVERIKRRIVDLQQGNPRKVMVIGLAYGLREEEKDLHHRFSEHRVRRPQATEWLYFRGPVRAWVQMVRIKKPIEVTAQFGRSASVAPRSGRYHCSNCRSAEHTAPLCPLLQHEKHTKVRGKTWEWRGKAREL